MTRVCLLTQMLLLIIKANSLALVSLRNNEELDCDFGDDYTSGSD